jgi:hypothetical protein
MRRGFIDVTRESMQEEQFWAIVDSARQQAGAVLDERVDALQNLLSALDLDAIVAYQRHYEHMIARAHRWDLWGAAYLINEGCSDDGFRHFCDWLISEGRATFERALDDPDSLALLPYQELAELELFGYVARAVYEQKCGKELAIDLSTDLSMPAGDEWCEEELPELFPRLTSKYWS